MASAIESLTHATGLIELLGDIFGQNTGSLYGSRWTCQAILRSLPPLAKAYVIRLLHVESTRPEVINNWARPESQSEHLKALRRLTELQVLTERKAAGGRVALGLHPDFRSHILTAAYSADSGLAAPSGQIPPGIHQLIPNAEGLTRYARERWEAMLYRLSCPELHHPDPDFVDLIESTLPRDLREYVRIDYDALFTTAELWNNRGGAPSLASSGFKFLLSDSYSQLRFLLRHYIQMEGRTDEERSGLVSFLLQLGFQEIGHPSRLAALAPAERLVAAHMAQLGVIYIAQSPADRHDLFYAPTRLASSLCASEGPSSTAQQSVQQSLDGYVVVETNYRVYGYTASPVKQALLRFFAQPEALLPNLFVGTITRRSIARAIDSGISAQQIVTFLVTHAHPQTARRGTGAVPETVADQIRLWETENNRLEATESFLLDKFEHPELFKRTSAKAKELGILLWENPGKEAMVVRDGVEGLSDFLITFIKETKKALNIA